MSITPESVRLAAAEAEAWRIAEETGDTEAALSRFREPKERRLEPLNSPEACDRGRPTRTDSSCKRAHRRA